MPGLGGLTKSRKEAQMTAQFFHAMGGGDASCKNNAAGTQSPVRDETPAASTPKKRKTNSATGPRAHVAAAERAKARRAQGRGAQER